MKQFEPLLGRWHGTGVFPIEPPMKLSSDATFERLGTFIVFRSVGEPAEVPDTISIIGGAPEGDPQPMQYFDSRGVKRRYLTAVEGSSWKIWRAPEEDWNGPDGPGFNQRFFGEITADGKTIETRWERGMGETGDEWELDFTMTYVRAESRKQPTTTAHTSAPIGSNEVGELDPRFSSPEATALRWETAIEVLENAKTYWLTTVRPDGQPNTATVAGYWLDGAFYFTTGPGEQKERNIANGNLQVTVATGTNGWDGFDVILEGRAVRVTDADLLGRVAEAFTSKYDDFFRLRLVDGRLGWADTDTEEKIESRKDAADEGGPLAFEVRPEKAFAFGKGDTFSQTRWIAKGVH